jgi:hypothetical protein
MCFSDGYVVQHTSTFWISEAIARTAQHKARTRPEKMHVLLPDPGESLVVIFLVVMTPLDSHQNNTQILAALRPLTG